MIKTLKFSSPLPELIKRWEKTSTWRLFDDKDIKTWDKIDLIERDTNLKFADALITSVKTLKFKDLSFEDLEWHEKFDSTEEMYETYTNYYKTKVDWNTELKIIRFMIKW